MRWLFRKVGIVVIVLLTSAVVTHAETLDDFDMTTFSPGPTIRSSEVNSNFQTLVNAMSRIGFNYNDTLITLNYSFQNIASTTITPPMDGVVLLIASAQVRTDSGAQSDEGGSATAKLCLTQTSNGCGDMSFDRVVSFSTPTYPYVSNLYIPVTVIAAYTVQANTPVTYYLTARQEMPSAGLCRVNGMELMRIFLPGALQ
jgi:hypothetical protein